MRQWFGRIPQLRDPARYQRIASYRSRVWKATGADLPAAALVRDQPGQVFEYRFDWDEEPRILWADLGELLGAAHALEIPFVFGHWDLGRMGEALFTRENEPGREALAEAMMSYWSAFADTGNPGRGRDAKQPEWQPWDAAGDSGGWLMLLDTPDGGGVRMASQREDLRALAAEIAADPDVGEDERCQELRNLVQATDGRIQLSDIRARTGVRCPSPLLAAGPEG